MVEIKIHIKAMMLLLLILIFLSNVGCSSGNNVPNNMKAAKKISVEDLSKYFVGYDGCFILLSQNENKYTVYNEAKIKKQLSPCSTFKIINSLIGLETKVLTDENTTFKWNLSKHYSNAWSKSSNSTEQLYDDKTLKSAATNDVVWYFQELALPAIDISAVATIGTTQAAIALAIPEGITITAPSNLDGVINAPTVKEV